MPFSPEDRAKLHDLCRRPAAERTKLQVRVGEPGGRRHALEVEVTEDPRDRQRKIFFLYDRTEVEDLRRLLDEKTQFQDLIGKSEPMRNVYS